MTAHYYLGANTPDGFRSLYDRFVTEDDRLYIIKGSPGSGKSTFMKKLAHALISDGVETELIHCSGDPESLDGVYFPQLKIAYVDGTAPHVIEPVYAGVSANYLNFGEAIDMDGLSKCASAIREYTALYKGQYVKAYSALKAARGVTVGVTDEIIADAGEAVRRRAMTLGKLLFDTRKGTGRVKERFIDALTCHGWEHRYDTVSAMTDTVYVADTLSGLNGLFIDTVSEYAVNNGWNVILCRDTVSPDKTAHIIVPGAGVAVISRYGELPQWNARAVRLDTIPKVPETVMERLKRRRKMWSELTDEAQSHLEQAKHYHDKLETIYRPYVDFTVIDRLCGEHIEMLKSRAGE